MIVEEQTRYGEASELGLVDFQLHIPFLGNNNCKIPSSEHFPIISILTAQLQPRLSTHVELTPEKRAQLFLKVVKLKVLLNIRSREQVIYFSCPVVFGHKSKKFMRVRINEIFPLCMFLCRGSTSGHSMDLKFENLLLSYIFKVVFVR